MKTSTNNSVCNHDNLRRNLNGLSPTRIGYSLNTESSALTDYLAAVEIKTDSCCAGEYETHTCNNCKKVIYARMHR